MHYEVGPWPVHSLNPGKWQTFAMEWQEDKIEVFADNIRVFRFSNRKLLRYFNLPMWTLITQAVIGEVNEQDPISTLELDYVRISM